MVSLFMGRLLTYHGPTEALIGALACLRLGYLPLSNFRGRYMRARCDLAAKTSLESFRHPEIV